MLSYNTRKKHADAAAKFLDIIRARETDSSVLNYCYKTVILSDTLGRIVTLCDTAKVKIAAKPPKAGDKALNDSFYSFFTKHEKKIRFVEKETKDGIKKVKERYVKDRIITESSNRIKSQLGLIEDALKQLLSFPQTIDFITSSVHSYFPKRSYATCAAEHTKIPKKYVYTMDVKNYFHSITDVMLYHAVKDLVDTVFSDKAIRENDAKELSVLINEIKETFPLIVSSLCAVTAPDKSSDRAVLAMGLEPAGVLANMVLRSADQKFMDICAAENIVYTRYSDNLIFSSKNNFAEEMKERFSKIIEEEDYYGEIRPFKLNVDKFQTKIPRLRQKILGVVINEKPNIAKETEQWLRSRLTHLHKDCEEFLAEVSSTQVLDNRAILKKYSKLRKDVRRAQGKLSFIKAINETKYFKYSAWLYSSVMTMNTVKEKIAHVIS